LNYAVAFFLDGFLVAGFLAAGFLAAGALALLSTFSTLAFGADFAALLTDGLRFLFLP
jgi:hypothetical protein